MYTLFGLKWIVYTHTHKYYILVEGELLWGRMYEKLTARLIICSLSSFCFLLEIRDKLIFFVFYYWSLSYISLHYKCVIKFVFNQVFGIDSRNSASSNCIFYIVNFVLFLCGQNKEENKESDKAVVLKAFIHCEGCSDKISKCLKGFQGN